MNSHRCNRMNNYIITKNIINRSEEWMFEGLLLNSLSKKTVTQRLDVGVWTLELLSLVFKII